MPVADAFPALSRRSSAGGFERAQGNFAKPAHPTYERTNILEDLRRRDFTVNAMAISLNEGSYGLLMDPTNGVADIEMRTLRLANNYGFLEDPIRLLRAVRLGTRLGWQMDERTKAAL